MYNLYGECMKKIFIRFILLIGVIGTLIISSIAYSNYRISLYSLSVVNSTKIRESDILEMLRDEEDHQIIVMIYDSADENSIYLDEVLMKDISIEHNGWVFEDIYRVLYENTHKAYTAQIIKNTYHVDNLPALVLLELDGDNYKTLDFFSWNSNITEGKKQLIDFLERNNQFSEE